jgi:uncharacterized protein (TIGR02996 family)
MSALEDVLDEVLRRPHEDEPRLRYAAACEAVGDTARAEVIRLQVQQSVIARTGQPIPTDLYARTDALLGAHAATWAGSLADWQPRSQFFRGFVERVAMGAGAFVSRAEALFRAAPIRRLSLRERGRVPAAFFESEHLARLVSIACGPQHIDDDGLQRLARSPYARNLKWLDLGASPVSYAGLEALAASQELTSLQYVNVRGTPIKDAVGARGYDTWGGNYRSDPSPEAQRLERSYGYKPWLHEDSEHPLSEHAL